MGFVAGIKRRSPSTYETRPGVSGTGPTGPGVGSTGSTGPSGPTGPGVGSTGPTGPSGPSGAASTGPTGPAGSDVVVADTFAALKAAPAGVDGDAAIMNGYHVPGDGGGGTFAWNTTQTSGDDIVVIQPTGVSVGAWVRIFDGVLNVKWGGAYGDGDHDDTAAIQAVLNVVLPAVQNPNTIAPMLSVFMPSGVYNVTPPMNQPALSINQPTILTGVGAGFTDQTTRIACSGYAPAIAGSAALAIEGVNSAAAGSRVDGILFTGHGTHIPQDLVVIHASNVTIANCGFNACWRYGICGSSGTTGTSAGDSALGMSSIPGNGVNAHFAQIINCYAVACGDIAPTLGGGESNLQVQVTANFTQPAIGATVTVQVNTTAPFTWDAQNPHPVGVLQLGRFGTDMYLLQSVVDLTHVVVQNVGAADSTDAAVTAPGTSFGNGFWFNIGAGLIVYGADANGWNVQAFNNGNCCNGTINSPQGSSLYSACYAQGTYYAHVDTSPGANTYVGCNQETVAECLLNLGSQVLLVGGSICSELKGGGNNYPARVSPTTSNLGFATLTASGAILSLEIPEPSGSAVIYFNREAPGETPQQTWFLSYETGMSVAPWGGPFQTSSWSWNGPVYLNAAFSPAGWTDSQNPRGAGLPFVAAPSMNTPMHFTWKQAVTLASGQNTVFLNGGTGGDAGAIPYLDDPTVIQLDGTVYSSISVGAPVISFTGTPTETLNPIEVVMTLGGGVGVAQFSWYIGGVLQASGVVTASSVALGATGITAHFPAGAYVAVNNYSAYSQWGNAQRKMNIELEFTSAALPTADCEIVGYAFVSEGSGTYNATCQIKNNAGAPVAATIVWTYDVFVTNYTVASGNIG